MTIKRYLIVDENQDAPEVHWDGCITDQTLCGLEMQGDPGIGLSEAEETDDPISCSHCLAIYNHCRIISSQKGDKKQ